MQEDQQGRIEKLIQVADAEADSKLKALHDEVSELRQRLEVAEGARSIAQRKLQQVCTSLQPCSATKKGVCSLIELFICVCVCVLFVLVVLLVPAR